LESGFFRWHPIIKIPVVNIGPGVNLMSAKVVEFKTQNLKQKEKERIILSYLNVVKIVAKKIYQKLPSNYELDDLISCGTLGLMDAIEKYDPAKGVKFKTYAEYRIKGQILDELRALDWASRATRDKIKNFEKVEAELQVSLGREVTCGDMCGALELKKSEYFKLLERIRPVQTISINPAVSGEFTSAPVLVDEREVADPYGNVEKNNVREIIREKIESLPTNEGKVLSLYYFEEKTMREISRELKVTESRVSQLHNSSMERLKKRVVDSELVAA
jgi:RNA polymerase sigma factor for flagellar operon FliA